MRHFSTIAVDDGKFIPQTRTKVYTKNMTEAAEIALRKNPEINVVVVSSGKSMKYFHRRLDGTARRITKPGIRQAPDDQSVTLSVTLAEFLHLNPVWNFNGDDTHQIICFWMDPIYQMKETSPAGEVKLLPDGSGLAVIKDSYIEEQRPIDVVRHYEYDRVSWENIYITD